MDFVLFVLMLIGFFVLNNRAQSRTRRLEAQTQAQLEALHGEIVHLRHLLGAGEAAAPALPETAPSSAPAVLPAPAASVADAPQPVPVAPAAPVGAPSLVRGVSSLPSELEAVAAPAPVPAPEPAEPSWVERVLESPLARWFAGTHMVVRAGIVVLFFGVAFLLKYAADQGWLSIELRLAGSGLLGFALVYAGWYVRERQRAYALTLQGGGLGIAYMTVFVAFRLYDLLPASVALPSLVALGLICATLAILNDAKALAVLAIAGGFAAPILIATGGGSHVGLFTYFALINAAILGIAWFKAWRELNLLGFVFTFVLATLWGASYYQPENFRTVEPFLVLFFLFYVAIGLLFARRQPPRLVGFVDGPLVFATPVVTAAWQARLVADFEYGLAWSALVLGAFYLALGFVLLRWASANYTALREAYWAIGAVFVTLTVPFAFEAQTTGAIWALEGAGLVWVGLRQERRFFAGLGIVVQGTAALALLVYLVEEGLFGPGLPDRLLNPLALGGLLIAAAAFATGYLALIYARQDRRLLFKGDLRLVQIGATLWAWLWWFGIGSYEIARFVPYVYGLHAAVLFIVISAAAGEWAGGLLNWRTLRLPALLLWVPVLLLGSFTALVEGAHLLANAGWLVWPVALAVHYWFLYRHDHVARLRFYHPLGVWLIAWLGSLELLWLAERWDGTAPIWDQMAWLGMPLLLMLGITLGRHRLAWPLARHERQYVQRALTPLALILVAGSVWINLVYSGVSSPLPYLPALNPFGIAQWGVLGALVLWFRALQTAGAAPATLVRWRVTAGVLLFLWIDLELARMIHQLWEVPFTFTALLRSALLQTVYSILWTLLAMSLMALGARWVRRWMWLAGAGLLALTVLKLFVVDLSGTGTLARIVSFIVVGLLMLLIGYVAPIPPKVVEAQAPEPS